MTDPPEMHPTRWGDPAAAAPLPEPPAAWSSWPSALDERPAVDVAGAARVRARRRRCSTASRELLGADHVLTDDETRRLRTRGKSTPDLLRARAGDLTDAPDAVVRPAATTRSPPSSTFAVEHHLAVVPFGGGTSVVGGLAARREGFAGVVSLDLVRMKRLLARRPGLDDRDPRARPARPGGRGAARRARPDARATSRSRSSTPRIGGFAATRSSGQSSAGYGRFDALVVGLTVATPQRPARPRAPRRPTPPAPTCASWCSAPRARSA